MPTDCFFNGHAKLCMETVDGYELPASSMGSAPILWPDYTDVLEPEDKKAAYILPRPG